MSLQKLLRVISLALVVSFFPSPGFGQTKSDIKTPVITHAYAVDKGRFGFTWKIYLEAETEGPDMVRIGSSVTQVGFGFYSRDLIPLKPAYRRHLLGYIEWNTFSNKTPYLRDYTQITLKVSIIDKAGNESKEAVFPLEFVPAGYATVSEPSPPFDKPELPKLGMITINLVEPTLNEPGSNK